MTWTSGQWMTERARRESALAVNRATQYHVRRRVEPPVNTAATRLPGPFDASAPLLCATRKLSVSGASIEEDFTLDVTTGTVSRQEDDAFVHSARQVDDAFRASTRIKLAAR